MEGVDVIIEESARNDSVLDKLIYLSFSFLSALPLKSSWTPRQHVSPILETAQSTNLYGIEIRLSFNPRQWTRVIEKRFPGAWSICYKSGCQELTGQTVPVLSRCSYKFIFHKVVVQLLSCRTHARGLSGLGLEVAFVSNTIYCSFIPDKSITKCVLKQLNGPSC